MVMFITHDTDRKSTATKIDDDITSDTNNTVIDTTTITPPTTPTTPCTSTRVAGIACW